MLPTHDVRIRHDKHRDRFTPDGLSSTFFNRWIDVLSSSSYTENGRTFWKIATKGGFGALPTIVRIIFGLDDDGLQQNKKILSICGGVSFSKRIILKFDACSIKMEEESRRWENVMNIRRRRRRSSRRNQNADREKRRKDFDYFCFALQTAGDYTSVMAADATRMTQGQMTSFRLLQSSITFSLFSLSFCLCPSVVSSLPDFLSIVLLCFFVHLLLLLLLSLWLDWSRM